MLSTPNSAYHFRTVYISNPSLFFLASTVFCTIVIKLLRAMFVGTAKAIFHTSLSGVTNAVSWVSLVAQLVKNLPAKQETLVGFLGQEDPLEKGMATHSSILAWRIPWRGTWQSACSSCVSCLTSDVITTNPVPQARILRVVLNSCLILCIQLSCHFSA